jgi:plasmid stabilization system protein ParE
VKLELAPEALDELDEAVGWYERTYAGRGTRFFAAVERAIEQILRRPLSYPPFLGTRARAALVSRFPYRIVYDLRAKNTVRIIAFAHTKRRPGHWRRRLAHHSR